MMYVKSCVTSELLLMDSPNLLSFSLSLFFHHFQIANIVSHVFIGHHLLLQILLIVFLQLCISLTLFVSPILYL